MSKPSRTPSPARSHHPALGTVVRCLWGHFHRKGESEPCTATFYSASDPDVISAQLAEAQWSSRRVRVPRLFISEIGVARATQPLCPMHTKQLADAMALRASTKHGAART